jgi:putative membrane protein insertion efficiency factor
MSGVVRGVAGVLRRGAAAGLIGAIRAYRLCLSPWLGTRCRYVPTCSVYAIEAIERFGPLRGAWLAAARIGRCHPWAGSGYDPVPEPVEPIDSVRRPAS